MTLDSMKLVALFLDSLEFAGIYAESHLDELQEADIYYDRFRSTLFTKYVSIPAPVRGAKEWRRLLPYEEAKLLEPGDWKAFIGWEICLALYELTGLPLPSLPMKQISINATYFGRAAQEQQWKNVFDLLRSAIKSHIRQQDTLQAISQG